MIHPRTSRFLPLALAGALLLPGARVAWAQPQPPGRPAGGSSLLKSVPVSGMLSDGGRFGGSVSITRLGYDATDGLTVDGVVTGTATSASGAATQVNQTFSNVKASLSELGLPPIASLARQGNGGTPGAAAPRPTPRPTPIAIGGIGGTTTQAVPAQRVSPAVAGQCDILHLDIGPISLDLLGLQLDLSQIVLDLTAVSGSGNLLGNLLCAVAGLLDPMGLLTDVTNFLAALTELLNQINALLG